MTAFRKTLCVYFVKRRFHIKKRKMISPDAVNRIKNQLEFLDKEASFSLDEVKKHGHSLSEYGLDDPAYVFKYGNEKKMYALKIGKSAPIGDRIYMLDENGRLPGIKPALMSDAIATTAGAVLGTSTVTTFVESSAGVAAGGRTGLTALTTGGLFLLATLFSPVFTSIPSFATAPALILVGFLMFESVTELKFSVENLSETIPAYLCILAMPLFYSISEGISLGIISYVVINLVCGKRKDITPLMYVLAVLFVLKYVFL